MNRIIQEDVEGMLARRWDLDKLAGQTILISGANSFFMSYFVYLLLENNRGNGGNTTILALCRSRESAQARFGDYLKDPHLGLLIQDVREPVRYDGAIDICIHAASPAGIQSRQESPVDTFQINLLGCQNLLELAREKHSQRFLLLSSVDAYGSFEDQRRRKETDLGCLDWTYARNAYSCGKRCAETLCALYRAQYDLPYVAVRPFQVYGPGMSLTDGRLHGDFIRQMREHNRIVLKSDGSAIRSFLYIADAAHALLDVLLYGAVGETYNICDEAGECSVKDLAKRYATQKGSGVEVVFDDTKRDTPEVKDALSVVTGDSSKLRSLGWRCEMPLEAGIKRTLGYYFQT